MKQTDAEPLLILLLTGLFMAALTGWVMPRFRSAEARPAAADSLALAAADTLMTADSLLNDTIVPAPPDTSLAGDSWAGMAPFYRALEEAKAGTTAVHIAFFGDSMIEGDLLTHPLRHSLQSRFGGHGVGFVPMTTPLPGFRVTVNQRFSDGWNPCSFIAPCKSDPVAPGLSGYAYRPEAGADATFATGAGYPPFHRIELLYGGKGALRLTLTADTTATRVTLSAEGPLAAYTLSSDTAFSKLKVRVEENSGGILYGVNIAYGGGVYVDNYAFRGNSGLPLASIPAELFSAFNTTLNNRLIVLAFGLNVFVPGADDYSWYEAAMRRVVNHVKQASPGASVLIVSMPDRATLIDGRYRTPDALPAFIRMQQRVALREQVAFFNLYAAMGGANSMKSWVEDRPKMAADDYTHPNSIGATRFASLLLNYLMTGMEHTKSIPDSVPVPARSAAL